MILYIFGDLDLDLGSILKKKILLQLEGRPHSRCEFQRDRFKIADATVNTDKLTNKQTRHRPEDATLLVADCHCKDSGHVVDRFTVDLST